MRDKRQTVKIELLNQWKLEAEFCNTLISFHRGVHCTSDSRQDQCIIRAASGALFCVCCSGTRLGKCMIRAWERVAGPSSHQLFVVFAYLLCLMHLVVLFAELISCVFCRVGKCAGEGYEA